MNKAYKIRLYLNQKQKLLINKTIGCSRFIYNQMLAERIEVYKKLKEDKNKLYTHKYKTEKEYKQEYKWLKEVSSRALQQSKLDLDTAYSNFFRKVKRGNNKAGFPKFKSKKRTKSSYREPQVGKSIEIKKNKIKLLKLGWINFKGLSKNYQGIIKSVTIEKRKDGFYFASILVEQKQITKKRQANGVIGIDLGIKKFAVCSNGEFINGIKDKLFKIEKQIKKIQKYHNKKKKGGKNREKCKIKLNKLYQYKTEFLNHFQWHLANKLCSENQIISLENLNIAGMIKNKKLAHSIHYSNWGSFINKLEQKAKDYNTRIFKVKRFFPSSKLCSNCSQIKEKLSLSDRIYECDCGLKIDRDLNASINILKEVLNSLSLEYSDYRCGENIIPVEIIYNFNGKFSKKHL